MDFLSFKSQYKNYTKRFIVNLLNIIRLNIFSIDILLNINFNIISNSLFY